MRSSKRSGSFTGAEFLLLLFIAFPGSAGDLVKRTLDTGENLFGREEIIVLSSGVAGALISKQLEDPGGHAGFLPGEPFRTMDQIDDAAFGYALPAASAVLWTAGELAGNGSVGATGETLCRGILYTYGITGSLKLISSRERPDGSDFRSFPSAHSAGTACAAAVLWRMHGEAAGIPAAAIALYTCLSRVNTGAHYPSDVIMGAAIGAACGLAATEVERDREGSDPVVSLGISINRNGRITPVLW